MANKNLKNARKAKNDEFYTQFDDIQKEMNAYLEYNPDVFRGKTILLPCDDPEWSNFTRYFVQSFKHLGLKKLISTCYALNDEKNGKIFTLKRDTTKNGVTNFDDLEWEYLKGDGDFRSDEITALRDEADFIITNPPFSLFREFMAWIMDGGKQFAVIGNMNAITYKEIFPLIQQDKMWLGATIHSGDREFRVPESYLLEAAGWRVDEYGNKYLRVNAVLWFSNIHHGRRNKPLELMTEADNIRHSKHKKVKGVGYQTYDNYNAIEVPFVDAIPSDFEGVMGVPISFLSKYNSDQFEIVGFWNAGKAGEKIGATLTDAISAGKHIVWNGPTVNGQTKYFRILIQHRKPKA